ncbi:OmpA family protein [Vibrio agarivorans]|uniref:OmpA family protein n=1 Tax=Vibrio agarivorans TaxID=153622 RepID=A0ABT7Y515_9VIBR|nr:OmpA family protein [Vibrio agarivorans]MDN2483146.1 OmpA family protein [Vibrio agarivorans]
MRLTVLALLAGVMLAGCAQEPDITMTRHQIDDLRDDDGDGVINQRDLCSNTPSGTIVDNKGCTQWQTVNERKVITVNFDMARHDIRDDQIAALDAIYEYLFEHDNANVVLVGDTSPEGTEEYNHQLAQKRSNAIRQQLVARGIDDARISEQEYYQITTITEQMDERNRRTIAVIEHPTTEHQIAWDIFTSERIIEGARND